MRRQYLPHQQTAVQLIREHNYCYGLFMAPGTMKTMPTIRTAKTPCLVICRSDDFLTWKNELQMEGFDPPYIIDHGKAELPEDDGWSSLWSNHLPEWTLITYDLVKVPRIFAWIIHQKFCQVIADEAHQIKRWKSQRTKACNKATRHISRRIALTGSAITNNPSDIYALGMFIDNGKTFGNNEWKFMQRYFLKEGHGWYMRRDAREQIAKRIHHLGYYVHEDDVLKLPPVRHVLKGAPLTSDQLQHYERCINDWEFQLQSGEIIEIDYVVAQLQKLRQIASGFLYTPEHDAEWFESGKMNMLQQNLQDADDIGGKEKLVIWCSATAEIEHIAEMHERIGRGYVTFYGKRNRKQREQARISMRDDPAIKSFIAQVDAGVGMNELIVADTAVYMSNSLRVISRQQSLRRIRRFGSERHKSITYYDYVSEGTIDVQLCKSINAAMSLAHEILSGLKEGKPLRKLLGLET